MILALHILLCLHSASPPEWFRNEDASHHHVTTMNQLEISVNQSTEVSKFSRSELGKSNAIKMHALLTARVAAGNCYMCNQPNPTGSRRCKACAEKANAAIKARRDKYHAEGKCRDCGQPVKEGYRQCNKCLEKPRYQRKARVADAACYKCGGPNSSKNKACSTCREKQRNYSSERRDGLVSKGLCGQCGAGELIHSGKFCRTCYFKTSANNWLEDARRWKELSDMFDSQNGLCAYTGDQLILGLNSSIDHKTPRSLGGKNEIENLHWITWASNRMKNEMVHDEYVRLCHEVASRYPLNPLHVATPFSMMAPGKIMSEARMRKRKETQPSHHAL